MTTLKMPSALSSAMLAVGAICLASVLSTTAHAQEFKWRLQSIETATGPGKVLMKPWLDEIKAASKGRLEISYYTAGQLLPADEILNGLKSGIIDMAFTTPLYTTGIVPEGFLSGPAMPPMVIKMSEATKDLYWRPGGLDDIMRDGFLRENAYYLNSVFAGGSIAIWSCKKPVNTLADVKGFKFRSFGKVATVFERLGAAPVALPHPEVYTAISQGIIDGSTGGSALFLFNKYYELCKYFYSRPVLELDMLSFMVSKKSWDKLPPDLQQLLKQQTRIYSDRYQKLTAQWQAEMISKFPEWKVQEIRWSDEFVEAVRKEGQKMLPEMKGSNAGLAKGITMIEEFVKTQK